MDPALRAGEDFFEGQIPETNRWPPQAAIHP
jgi:hypothetical protein